MRRGKRSEESRRREGVCSARRGSVSKRCLSAREEGGVGVVRRGRRRGGCQQGREGGGEEEERVSQQEWRVGLSATDEVEEGRESETFRFFFWRTAGQTEIRFKSQFFLLTFTQVNNKKF